MKTLFAVLLLTLAGCGSSTAATTSDDDDSGSRPGQDFFDVTPVATPEPTPEETPVSSPTPEPTPVFENCHTDKFTLCHVPDDSGTDAMWLCVDEDGKDMHLSSHAEDYLFGDEGTLCP